MNYRSVLFGSLGKVAFIIVPLSLLLLSSGGNQLAHGHLLDQPEWSVASTVFFGQAMVALVQGWADGSNIDRRLVGGVTAAIVVLGLVPALYLVMRATAGSTLPTLLRGLQMVEFVLGVVTFMVADMYREAAAHFRMG